MSFGFKSDQAFLGLLQDKYISFNIRRSHHNFSPFPRKVTLFPVSHLAKTIIPGIKERSERRLIEELKQYQNWKKIKNHSFEISPHLFSFLWRFKMDQQIVIKEVKNIEPLAAKTTKNVKTALCVLAAQPITTDDFLDSALVCIGSIRKGLTDFVRERLKNL